MKVVALVALLSACGFEVPGQPTGDAHPISNAGTGSSYPPGTAITLDGSDSFDPDGQLVAYHWSVRTHPTGSTVGPLDPDAATTMFTPDRVGTYILELLVRDDAENSDSSYLRIVVTGAITSIDAGPDASVSWLGTAQLAGSVTTKEGLVATYSWAFVSRPPGSAAMLDGSTTLTPSFMADAVGTYVIALDARVDNEIREDTVTVEVTDSAVSFVAGNAAYTYAKSTDRIVYVHDVGHAELVQVDPMTAAQTTLDIGTFPPRSISMDPTEQVIAVGGFGKVVTVSASQFVVMESRDAPGCTAGQVTVPHSNRVDCFPADADTEPISSVNMTTGVVTQIPCPVLFPHVALATANWMYMVDAASPSFYLYDVDSTPPLQVLQQWNIPGVVSPVIAAGTNQPFAVTGNGLAINLDGTVRFDLQTLVSVGAFSGLHFEIAVVSGTQLKVFGAEPAHPLKLSATLPLANGVTPDAKLVAYSADEHRLIIVAGTPARDVVYTVPR
jgi:hypothetical protein